MANLANIPSHKTEAYTVDEYGDYSRVITGLRSGAFAADKYWQAIQGIMRNSELVLISAPIIGKSDNIDFKVLASAKQA